MEYILVASAICSQYILCVVCGVTFNASHYDWLSTPSTQLCTITGNVIGNAETTGRLGIIEEWIYKPSIFFHVYEIGTYMYVLNGFKVHMGKSNQYTNVGVLIFFNDQ